MVRELIKAFREAGVERRRNLRFMGNRSFVVGDKRKKLKKLAGRVGKLPVVKKYFENLEIKGKGKECDLIFNIKSNLSEESQANVQMVMNTIREAFKLRRDFRSDLQEGFGRLRETNAPTSEQLREESKAYGDTRKGEGVYVPPEEEG